MTLLIAVFLFGLGAGQLLGPSLPDAVNAFVSGLVVLSAWAMKRELDRTLPVRPPARSISIPVSLLAERPDLFEVPDGF